MAETPGVPFIKCANVMCSSDVPGGESTTKKSSSPAYTHANILKCIHSDNSRDTSEGLIILLDNSGFLTRLTSFHFSEVPLEDTKGGRV
jgi:hypothetical protein